MSLSSRRAWIEMQKKIFRRRPQAVALLTESVDWNSTHSFMIFWRKGRSPHGERGLKCQYNRAEAFLLWSLSSRRAWIEIDEQLAFITTCPGRSPHGERGLKSERSSLSSQHWTVALLTESVDWNKLCQWSSTNSPRVALLTESVDWNSWCTSVAKPPQSSLSSRRAWIEIRSIRTVSHHWRVALLTESVDWNLQRWNR